MTGIAVSEGRCVESGSVSIGLVVGSALDHSQRLKDKPAHDCARDAGPEINMRFSTMHAAMLL